MMTVSDWIQIIAASATVILLIAAGAGDLLKYRISNRIVVAVVVAFVLAAVFKGSWPAFGWSALAALGMLFLGAGLFALGLFGGGDVKLISAMALWTGIVDLPRFLLVMSAAGGVLGVVWLVRRRRRHAQVPVDEVAADGVVADRPISAPESNPPKVPDKLPYGVAIALAGIDFFVTSARSPFAPLMLWAS